MSTSGPFRIVDHVVPCQHIREYPAATANEQEDTLRLAVKQYIPLDNPRPQRGDVTIIAAHANGFTKELYEPLWEEIYARSKSNGFRIRSIWMADVAHQGQSGVLNENLLGNDPSWFDHPRDLLNLINVKRDEIKLPIVGIGHSFGGAHLVQLSLMHPRLFHTLILLDPVIRRITPHPSLEEEKARQASVAKATQLSTYRRDLWPSRQAAIESFKRNPFYQSWDPRVLDRWIKYALRNLPTPIYPLNENNNNTDNTDTPVTLTTPLHQEVFTFSRPTYTNHPAPGKLINKQTHPDLDATQLGLGGFFPFYRPEPHQIFAQLPHLRPSVLYIFGGQSEMSVPELRRDKLQHTGTGLGGSGGVAEGRVGEVVLEGKGHLVAQEAVGECAEAAGGWLGSELRRWGVVDRGFWGVWGRKSGVEKVTVDAAWREHVPPPERKRRGSSKL